MGSRPSSMGGVQALQQQVYASAKANPTRFSNQHANSSVPFQELPRQAATKTGRQVEVGVKLKLQRQLIQQKSKEIEMLSEKLQAQESLADSRSKHTDEEYEDLLVTAQALQLQCAELQAQLADHQNSSISVMQNSVKLATNRAQGAEQQLKDLQQIHSSCPESIAELRKENFLLKSKAGQTTQDNTELLVKLIETEQAHEVCGRNIARFETKIQQLEKELVTVSLERDLASKDTAALKESYAEEKKRATNVTLEFVKHKKEKEMEMTSVREDWIERNRLLTEETMALSKAKAAVEGKLSNSLLECNLLKLENKQYKERNEELVRMNADLEEAMKRKSSESARFKNDYKEALRTMKAQDARILEFKGKIETLTYEVKRMRSELITTTSRLTMLEDEEQKRRAQSELWMGATAMAEGPQNALKLVKNGTIGNVIALSISNDEDLASNAKRSLNSFVGFHEDGETTTAIGRQLHTAVAAIKLVRNWNQKLAKGAVDDDKASEAEALIIKNKAIMEKWQTELGCTFQSEQHGIGIVIIEVAKDRAAFMVGLQPGDIITAIDGAEMRNKNEFSRQIKKRKPGDKIILTQYVTRGPQKGDFIQTSVMLGAQGFTFAEAERVRRIASGVVYKTDMLSGASKAEKDAEIEKQKQAASATRRDVFLGGSCNPTTWRMDLAMPLLESNLVSFYNPQVDDWSPELVEIEARAKEDCKVLLFVIDGKTRALASMLEASEYIGVGRRVVIVIQHVEPGTEIGGVVVGDREIKDLNRAREYLADVADRHGTPCFRIKESCIHDAVWECIHSIKGQVGLSAAAMKRIADEKELAVAGEEDDTAEPVTAEAEPAKAEEVAAAEPEAKAE